jgi:hypothetical protein
VVRCLAAGVIAWFAGMVTNHHLPAEDFSQVHAAARALRDGKDPYQEIGPHRSHPQGFPYLYPAPASLIALPLAPLDPFTARVVFVSLGAALLAFFATRDSLARLPLFAGVPFLLTAEFGQWPAHVAVGMLVPVLGFFAVAKPNIGLAALAGMKDRRAFLTAAAGCALITIASFISRPGWFGEWREAIRHAPDNIPIAFAPGGFLMAAAALRWRRPEGRLLFVLSMVPQNPLPNSAVLFIATPLNAIESTLLAAVSWLVIPLGFPSTQELAGWSTTRANTMRLGTLLTCYLPMLLCVLRRPNVGAVPEWLERRIAWMPRWIVGRRESAVGSRESGVGSQESR